MKYDSAAITTEIEILLYNTNGWSVISRYRKESDRSIPSIDLIKRGILESVLILLFISGVELKQSTLTYVPSASNISAIFVDRLCEDDTFISCMGNVGLGIRGEMNGTSRSVLLCSNDTGGGGVDIIELDSTMDVPGGTRDIVRDGDLLN